MMQFLRKRLLFQIPCSIYPVCSSPIVFPVFCFAIIPLLKNFILPYFTCSEKVVAFRINPSIESQEKSKNINLLFSQLYVKMFLLILRKEDLFLSKTTLFDSRIKKYAYCKPPEICRDLGTSALGLSGEQVDAMREKYGKNSFQERKTDTTIQRLRRAFINPFHVRGTLLLPLSSFP